MELRSLRCFVRLAEELHFGRAAKRLTLTTSRVSQELRQLERELGVPLFFRTSRSVQLTPQGSFLLDHVRRLLDDAEELKHLADKAGSAQAGHLAISYAPL